MSMQRYTVCVCVCVCVIVIYRCWGLFALPVERDVKTRPLRRRDRQVI